MRVELYIGTDKLDLFGDENIEITSAVSDITDITKNLTDYSRNFTVPASEINNRIFKHYYNATIDNTFDARTKVDSSIYLDGVLFREGEVQLNKVDIKKGKPSTYTLFFFGRLINLSKLVGDNKLADLDLSAFDHEYNSANVKLGLESSLFGGDLIYSLFLKKQALYDSDPSNTTNLDNLVNIAYQGGANSNGIEYNTLRPSLKNIRIIEAIESKYGITFSRDFFGRVEFQNTFLWLNNTSEKKTGGGVARVTFDGGDFTFIDPATSIGSYFSGFLPSASGIVEYTTFLYITPEPGFENVPYTILYYLNGELVNESPQVGAVEFKNELRYRGDDFTYEVYHEIRSEDEFSFESGFVQAQDRISPPTNVYLAITTGSTQTINSDFDIKLQAPDIKIIDYLKGFFQMFKLVIISTGKNTLYVNTQKEYYRQGQVFDITKYVDQENYSVQRGDLLNRINYSFEEPKAILNVEFEKQNNEFYGDEETSLRVDQNDPNSELIDGKEENFEIPFETIVYNRLIDEDDSATTNIMYAPVIDEELKPVNPAPHIHYITNQSLGSKTIGLINEVGNKIEVTSLNIPLHCEKITDPNFSLLFSQELNEWNGSTMQNTLFSNYHAEYIFGIFNIKRRDYKYKAFLPFNILTKLSLDDVLKIKDQFFRIDKFTLNLTSGETKLDLISSFGRVNLFSADRTFISVDYTTQTESEYITNGQNVSFVKNDTGDGIGWVTVSVVGQIIYFDFQENTGFATRSMTITVTNVNNPTQQIVFTLFQSSQFDVSATADSTIITVDNNTITVDNG